MINNFQNEIVLPGPSRGRMDWGGGGGVEGEIAERCQSNFPTFSNSGTMPFYQLNSMQDYVLRCDHYIESLFNGQLYNIRL